MLGRARISAPKVCHSGVDLELVQADLANAKGWKTLASTVERTRPQRFLFTLGLTCISDWRELFSAVFEAASPGSTFAIMDVFSERLTLGARFINWVGAADCTMPVWQELERRAEAFEMRRYRPFRFLDVSVIVAWGRKA